MNIETIGNQLRFLLDGESFFSELTQQIDRVIKATPNDRTYVRMAFWEADAACWIDRSMSSPRHVGPMLKTAADAGHTVQFICWKPRGLAGPLLSLGWKLPAPIPNYQSAKIHSLGEQKNVRGSVQVYREEHKGAFFGTSNHQKIAIFSIDGVLTAIIGGMNLTNKTYAPVTHDPRAQKTGLLGAAVAAGLEVAGTENWHDTAIVLTGPAAAAVEEEWLRRWNKRKPSPRLAPVKAPKQAPIAGGHAVTILTTNLEASAREMHIREALCARIATAERYVYLENYVLSDPLIVAALADRLRARKDLVVLFVTAKEPRPYNILNRMTMLRLVLAAGGEGYIQFEDFGEKKRIEEHFKDREVSGGDFSAPPRLDKLKLLGNPWFEKDEFRYKTPEGEQKRVPLGKIYYACSNRVLFAYPNHGYLTSVGDSLYVHSKLVLVDDDTAFIGSANLSYRSMVYDGEICARIAGSAAKDIREALFKHFNLDFADARAIQAAVLNGSLLSALAKLGKMRPRPGITFLQAFQHGDYSFERPKLAHGDHSWH
jgi:phosphatidylserine/phosphatidylglycerophosphate/cardiolipin synthase-like enzyme